jgi:hypothetical protein
MSARRRRTRSFPGKGSEEEQQAGRRRTNAATVFSYTTSHVVFLLASQPRHAAGFRRQLGAIVARWGPKEIIAEEYHETHRPDISPAST